jgi:heme oxygenase
MADISTFSAPPLDRTISSHAGSADAMARRGFGPRVRRLHARIGAAHRQAEGMVFSRALLDGNVSPLQLAALIRALAPAYERIERLAPPLVEALGGSRWPWAELARSRALRFDVERLAVLPATPVSPAAQAWLQRLEELASTAPHRFLAHVYVRYGGDLSGGQQLAAQAAAILADHGLPPLGFWQFARPVAELKQRFHDSFEQLVLSAQQEQELLDECEAAFRATQGLLAELAEPAMPMPGDPALPTTVPVAPVPVASACVDDVLELLLRYDRPVPRYTSYPTAAAFAPGVTAADLVAELRRAASEPLSLYVHVPFCRHACWYCGCNRVTTQAGSKVVEPYLRSVARELALLEQAGAARRPLVQLHWGGGTPNYLNAGE